MTCLPYLVRCAACLAIAIIGWSCDDEQRVKASLKGQSNTTLVFYGRAEDETGQPLEGARFEMEIEAIPPDWTVDTRGKPHDFSTVSAQSGRDGRFQFDIVGHVLRLKRSERAGYRHFFDLAAGNSEAVDNTFYSLSAWGDLDHKTDVDHPAIYVFVKDGIKEVSALPCRGGYSFDGRQWTANQPAWPKKPSLTDVVWKPPTTVPTTEPEIQKRGND